MKGMKKNILRSSSINVDKKLQYDFLINTIVSRKRYASWLRPSKTKNLEYVKEYYGYSNSKAKSVLDILNDEQLEFIKSKLFKGGKK